MEVVAYGGWERNARLVCRDTEMIVTMEVGPRILHYGFTGGPNLLKVYEKDLGRTGDPEYRSYGGHRLWIAPEEDPKTMTPENGPVVHTEEDGWDVFTSAVDPWHMQKELRIRAIEETGAFEIEHRVYNRGVYDAHLAPWAITVVEPGGVCVFPQHPFTAHSQRVLPVRPLVLWGYTDMSDPRFRWGKELIRVRHDSTLGNTKMGMLVQQGWSGYVHGGTLFLKRFPFDPYADYPDFGVNFECFTREDMLEFETLGELEVVEPDSYAVHFESWYLVPNFTLDKDEFAARQALEEVVAQRPL